MTAQPRHADPAVTPLRVRSGHSLLRGTATPEAVVQRAGALGHKYLAITDVNSLAGATEFHAAAKAAGITPIIGAELLAGPQRIVTLATSETGYGNLCQLITAVHAHTQLDLAAAVAAAADGLELIADSPAMVEALLAAGAGDYRGAAARGKIWVGVDPASQSRAEIFRLAAAARCQNLPLLATADALLARPDDADAARLLAAMRLRQTVDTVPRAAVPPAAAHLRAADDLARACVDMPGALANNRALAEACSEFSLLPRETVFPAYSPPDGLTPQAYLHQLCRRGAEWRYGGAPPDGFAARLTRELALIERRSLAEYFLVVWDIVSYARSRGVPVAGRGSGASSLVAYLLGVTNVCPLTYDIPFERFLNAERTDYPDLDIDFCWRVRDDVIDYAFNCWGDDHVAMVCTHSTFQARSALRETAKAFGLSDEQINRLGHGDDQRTARIVALSRRILHLPHNLSVHPGGIVMSPGRIDRIAPLEMSAKGAAITQYDKRGVEAIGLVKIDLLGNRSLSTIRSACEIVRSRDGREIDIDALPDDDPATLALLQSADTVGCNQLESPAMRYLLRGMCPAGIADVMKALALIRPGAAGTGMKDVFIRRHRRLEAPPPTDPRIARVLADTYGVMLYEDDVMLLAAAMLGSSPAEGDRFRKGVQSCKSDSDRLAISREFIARCVQRGFDRRTVEDIWVQMAKFNAYSFCRAHAGSYGRLAWVVAYLKTHHPLAFWVGALNNNQSMYHPRVYVEQAKRMGIRFLAPDVNRSHCEFTVEGDSIRLGLNCVGGLGPAGIRKIIDARSGGEFATLSELLRRTALGDDEMRSLILCGACDSFSRSRPALMMELALARDSRPVSPDSRTALLAGEVALPHQPDDYTPQRKYADERRIMGLSVREHVMAVYRPTVADSVTIDSRQMGDCVGRPVRIAGVLEAVRTTSTRNGGAVTFLTMDDEFGLFEGVYFHRKAGRRRLSFSRYGPYVLAGRVQDQYGTLTVATESVELRGRAAAKPITDRYAEQQAAPRRQS